MTSNSVVMFIDRAEVCASKVGIDSENDFIRHRRHRVALRSIDEMCNLEADLTLKEFFWKEFQLVLDTLINMLQSNMKLACIAFLNPVFRSNLTINKLNAALDMFTSKDTQPAVYALQAEMEMLFDNSPES